MTTPPIRFQHPGALKEARRLIQEALDTGATHLDLSGLRLRYLPDELFLLRKQLTSIDIGSCTTLINLTGIEQLTGLLELDLSNCGTLTGLKGIEQLTALLALDISNCNSLNNLSGIEALRDLARLNIYGCSSLNCLDGLKNLIQLEKLELGENRVFNDIGIILTLTRLKELDISGCPALLSLIGIAQLTQLQALSIFDCKALASLAGIEHLTQLTVFQIGWCTGLIGLTEVESLNKLTELTIGDVKCLTNMKALSYLTELKSLIVYGCEGMTSLSGIEKLTNLIELEIYECDTLCNVTGIEHLTNLTRLHLSECNALVSVVEIEKLTELKDLQIILDKDFIGNLSIQCAHKLKKLTVGSGKSLSSIIPIGHFPALTELAIYQDDTLENPSNLAHFPHLTELTLGLCNKLTSLAGLEMFYQLTELKIFACDSLTNLSGIENNKQLTKLSIEECDELRGTLNFDDLKRLTNLEVKWCDKVTGLSGLQHFKHLKKLEIIRCDGLTELPDLAHITTLQELTIQSPLLLIDSNQLQPLSNLNELSVGAHLPLAMPLVEKWLLQKSSFKLRAFARGSLFVTHMPPELSVNFNQTAFEDWWFAGQQTGFAPAKQLKVMFLGNGRIGKTQLARRLRGDSFDETIPSTHGIQLHTVSWPQLFGTQGALPPPVDPAYADVQLHCWDFGGQDVYLGTHSLFLDSQAVYLLLWHPDAENNDQVNCETLKIRNRPLSYWLAYLKSLVGAQANILVCQSQCDTPDQHRNAPVPNPPPFKALRPLDISSKTNDGLDQFYPTFKKALQQQLQSNCEIWLPNCWLAVEQDIRKLIATQPKLKQLPYVVFVALCEKHLVTAPATLANFLHQSGVVFFRIGHFNNQLILDQQWALQGVYLLLDRQTVLPELQASKGRFSRSMLQRWLQLQQLENDDLPLFLEMMLQCGACFQVNDTDYIAPDNLPDFDTNEADQRWQDATSEFEIELAYEFLHDATMRYLLSKIGDVAKEHAYYWRYGCCFYNSKHKAKVWFECKLLPASTEQIDNYRQPGVIVIRVAGGHGAELTKHLIESIAEVGHLGQLPEVRWVKGQAIKAMENESEQVKPTPFSDIGPAAPPPPKQPSVYFSYAWGKESEARQQVSDQILLKLEAENFQVFRDKESTSLGGSIDDFERRIGRSDFVLVILSHKYLYESLHCMKELALLYERSQRQQQEFTRKVIPVVMADVNIDNHIERLKIVRKWQLQMEELQTLVNEVGTESAGSSSVAELTMLRAVVNCCADALSWISDLITERHAELQVDATVQLVKSRISEFVRSDGLKLH